MIGPAPLVTGVKVVGWLVGGIIGGGGRFELVVISAMFDGIPAAAGVELMRLGGWDCLDWVVANGTLVWVPVLLRASCP